LTFRATIYLGNHRKPERSVKSKEGKVITNTGEQQNRWVEHFNEFLNRPAPLNPAKVEAAPTDLSIDVGPPTIEEISVAIRQIKSGEVKGPDNIPAEALYGSLWNNQLNGIHHSTSTSWTTKEHLIAWREQHYGSSFDTTACVRR
uniref:Adenylate kinase n=1 Tax=Schistosoma curassoni TaxID=6186 RepID=A0A183KYH6_9TREM